MKRTRALHFMRMADDKPVMLFCNTKLNNKDISPFGLQAFLLAFATFEEAEECFRNDTQSTVAQLYNRVTGEAYELTK